MPKTWFITGASRGLGVEIAKAALRAGDRVVAAARRPGDVGEALGPDDASLRSVALDVTQQVQADAAVAAAVQHFGGIDVLVNNAGYGHLGFFEETTDADARAQFDTNLFGAFAVTRAVLPVMRRAGAGRIFNISSIAGLRGGDFTSLYSASKFALEGFSESLALEVEPFGIHVTLIEPGPFRTDFLTRESLRFGGRTLDAYDAKRQQMTTGFESRNGGQAGNPAKLAEALVRLAREAKPPLRFLAGALAVAATEVKLAAMQAEFKTWRQLSLDTDGWGEA